MSEGSKIRILFFKVGEKPKVMQVTPELSTWQRLVGGYIEHLRLDRNVSLYCNEEGRITGLPANRTVPKANETIHGNFVVFRAGTDGEEHGLTDEDIKKYTNYFL